MFRKIGPNDLNNILDTETTGLSAVDGDRLIEIGIVKMKGFNPIAELHLFINPGTREIAPEAFRVHGITADMLRDKPYFDQVAPQIIDFIGNDPLVIHNAEFDMGFLNEEMRQCNLPPLRNTTEDTVAMSRRKFPGSPSSLDALTKRFKIENLRKAENGRHGALIDAKLLAMVWVELHGGRQERLTLDMAGPTDAADEAAPANTRRFRVVQASDAERTAHAAFLDKNVKDAIWGTL